MHTTLLPPTDVTTDATSDVATTPSPAGTTQLPKVPTTNQRLARAHRRIARVLLGCLALQLFFAGLGVFGITSFLPHVILGSAIVAGSFALPLIAWRGHLATSVLRRSWVLAGLMILQGLLIDAGRIVPVVSALHPVNAMLLVLVTFSLV